MLFDLFLAMIFIGSTAALWYFISLKIPELVAVSDAVIVERLHEDSARIRIFLLHFKIFYRQGRHRVWFWRMCGKACWRAHILFLRADNGIMKILQRIRASVESENPAAPDVVARAPAENGRYWSALRVQEPEERIPSALKAPPRPVRAPRPSRLHARRIQEVRVKNK